MERRVKTAQHVMVLNYMKDFGSITSYQAFQDLGVTRLSACIYTLRKHGLKISSKRVATRNRYNDTVYFSKYKLYEQKEAAGA